MSELRNAYHNRLVKGLKRLSEIPIQEKLKRVEDFKGDVCNQEEFSCVYEEMDAIISHFTTEKKDDQEADDKEADDLKQACDLLHSCLEWDNGGERDYDKIVEFLNRVEKK